jgi:S-adenosylmethionine:tRNA ribosyltransferase-isomerase
VLVSEFDYQLPEERIAQEPLTDRAASRLLHLERKSSRFSSQTIFSSQPMFSSQNIKDGWFRDFPDLLKSTDLLVLNNTRVLPARLYGRRSGDKAQPSKGQTANSPDFLRGKVEVLLTRPLSDDSHHNDWECLVRPGRKIGVGERLFFGDADELQATVIDRGGFGERRIRFSPVADFLSTLDRLGHVPLPPYINRPDRPADRERYQTIYSKASGSSAAPTAGLHFTPEILSRIKDRGIETAEITLHVGLGTFQPVRVDRVEDHKLHREPYSISEQTAAAINQALDSKRRVIAIGTTTVRTLEYAALIGNGRVQAGSGEADIFMYPGYEFRVVHALLTNFHLPQSTLLMLVCAFGGKDAVLEAYRHAVEHKYRFYSYGDCMFLE